MGQRSDRTKVFYAFAYEDKSLFKKLKNHLAPLKNQEQIEEWDNQQALAGSTKLNEINQHLDQADLIVMLISSHFEADSTCIAIKDRAKERLERRDVYLIPVLLRPVYLLDPLFDELQVLPRAGKAVTEEKDQDRVFSEIAKEIHRVIKSLYSEKKEQLNSSFSENELELLVDKSEPLIQEIVSSNTIVPSEVEPPIQPDLVQPKHNNVQSINPIITTHSDSEASLSGNPSIPVHKNKWWFVFILIIVVIGGISIMLLDNLSTLLSHSYTSASQVANQYCQDEMNAHWKDELALMTVQLQSQVHADIMRLDQSSQAPYTMCTSKEVSITSTSVEMRIDESVANSVYHRSAVITKQADSTWKISEFYSVEVTDSHSVFTMLNNFCNLIKNKQYLLLFNQWTTSVYQNKYYSAQDAFSFKGLGGIADCFAPEEKHIFFLTSSHSVADCVVYFETGDLQHNFYFLYHLKLDNGIWKINEEGELSTEQQHSLTFAQCGNFS